MSAILSPMIRWAARISGLLVALAFGLLFLGEFFQPHSGPPPGVKEWTGILLLAACCAGMLLAWRHELAGALLSLIALNALAFIVPFWQYTVLFVISIPSFLYLADWILEHNAQQTGRHA
ncbi:MAG: hypothetical protein JNK48_24435 [Bryobacterales bacterium]|nr:hypothetical protein [Bryobacterales bacterium]